MGSCEFTFDHKTAHMPTNCKDSSAWCNNDKTNKPQLIIYEKENIKKGQDWGNNELTHSSYLWWNLFFQSWSSKAAPYNAHCPSCQYFIRRRKWEITKRKMKRQGIRDPKQLEFPEKQVKAMPNCSECTERRAYFRRNTQLCRMRQREKNTGSESQTAHT